MGTKLLKTVDNLFVKTTKGLHQTLAMAEKDKNDTEESDLEDYLDDDDDDEIDAEWIQQQLEEDIRSEIIDIKEPLKSIREPLGSKLMIDLSECEFCLEDNEKLDSESTLATFCEKDEGLVEIDFEIKEAFKECGEMTYIINIVNVVEPRDNSDVTTNELKFKPHLNPHPYYYKEPDKPYEERARDFEHGEGPSKEGSKYTSTREVRKTIKRPTVILGQAKSTVLVESAKPGGGYRSGRNGQLELWRFLLELLTDKEHRDVIYWVGVDGEFKMEKPEIVSKLWGAKKNNPRMNYEKMSRALRFYNGGDIINKVRGKNFMYKFVCDLKEVVGYSVKELNDEMLDAVEKERQNNKYY